MVKRLTAEQPQRERHVSFVVREIMHAAQHAQRVALLQTRGRLEAHEKILSRDHLGRRLADKRLHRHPARGEPPFAGAARQRKFHRGLALGISDDGWQPLTRAGQLAPDDGIHSAAILASSLVISSIQITQAAAEDNIISFASERECEVESLSAAGCFGNKEKAGSILALLAAH